MDFCLHFHQTEDFNLLDEVTLTALQFIENTVYVSKCVVIGIHLVLDSQQTLHTMLELSHAWHNANRIA